MPRNDDPGDYFEIENEFFARIFYHNSYITSDILNLWKKKCYDTASEYS